jgi:hypothetical protein
VRIWPVPASTVPLRPRPIKTCIQYPVPVNLYLTQKVGNTFQRLLLNLHDTQDQQQAIEKNSKAINNQQNQSPAGANGSAVQSVQAAVAQAAPSVGNQNVPGTGVGGKHMGNVRFGTNDAAFSQAGCQGEAGVPNEYDVDMGSTDRSEPSPASAM